MFHSMFLRRYNGVASIIRMKSNIAASVQFSGIENGLSAELESANATQSQFARARIGQFFQPEPCLHNPFEDDKLLQRYLNRILPPEVYANVTNDLKRFGKRIVSEIDQLGRECELNPPSLLQYNSWGKRVDEIITCPAWKRQHAIAAEEGVIALAYEQQHGEWSRLHQLCKLYLYQPSSGLYSCPLAMTDGAAKLIHLAPEEDVGPHAFKNLTSRDPVKFWTSGQWMTERQGGSDVASGTETIAVPQADGSYHLYGYKSFTSATDSNMSFTLARIADKSGSTIQGSKGLSLFFLETRDSMGRLNNIEIQRLKDKLGTRQLPTAELLLDGAVAYKVGPEGRGVAGIIPILKMTRIHNAIAAVGGMRRLLSLSRDYSTKRKVFGKLICNHALHIQTLARLEVETRGAFLLTMELARLLGLEDVGKSTEHDQLLLRLLVPLAKLYTGKQALKVGSEALESFGGQGYMEDTALPSIVRDAQVLSIWEGTTNVLSLDVLRSLAKSHGSVLHAYVDDIQTRLKQVSTVEALAQSCELVQKSAHSLVEFAHGNIDQLETAARDFSYSLARTYMGMLLLENAAWKNASQTDITAAQRWCTKQLNIVEQISKHDGYKTSSTKAEFDLVMDGYIVDSKF